MGEMSHVSVQAGLVPQFRYLSFMACHQCGLWLSRILPCLPRFLYPGLLAAPMQCTVSMPGGVGDSILDCCVEQPSGDKVICRPSMDGTFALCHILSFFMLN